MKSNYRDCKSIREGYENCEKLFSRIRADSKGQIEQDFPKAMKSEAPIQSIEKKTGFLSMLKGYASDFKQYLKEHPVKGGALIALGILGIALIAVPPYSLVVEQLLLLGL